MQLLCWLLNNEKRRRKKIKNKEREEKACAWIYRTDPVIVVDLLQVLS